MNKVLLWDFDGTIATREGNFSGALAACIRRHIPFANVSPIDLQPGLSSGFPWHTPDVVHPQLAHPDTWWATVEAIFVQALNRVGIDGEIADAIARSVRRQYLNSEEWIVADGARDVLEATRATGWKSYIVSNHVPELPELVQSLGFDDQFEAVFTSARLGVEKPNPKFFDLVLNSVGPTHQVWIIGDNPVADIAGGRRAGLKTIYVGGHEPLADVSVQGLRDVSRILAKFP